VPVLTMRLDEPSPPRCAGISTYPVSGTLWRSLSARPSLQVLHRGIGGTINARLPSPEETASSGMKRLHFRGALRSA
jgi:hypothetical protein